MIDLIEYSLYSTGLEITGNFCTGHDGREIFISIEHFVGQITLKKCTPIKVEHKRNWDRASPSDQ